MPNAIEELTSFFAEVSGKLNTPKKRKIAQHLLEELKQRGGRANSWQMSNEIVPIIVKLEETSKMHVYNVLGELIELGLIAKTRYGYIISPAFRKKVYRLYKLLGEI